jgi:TonB family protein
MRRLWIVALALALPAIASHAQQATQPASAAPPAAQPPASKINPPAPLNTVEPQFPEDARQRRINGRCLVSLTVDLNGMPQDIKLLRCTDPAFEANSLDAVKQYRFQPATTQEGKQVSSTIAVEVDFRVFGAPETLIRLRFSSPPAALSLTPGKHGLCLFTKLTTLPAMKAFSDKGFEQAASGFDGSCACDVVLTINANGKASDPQVTHCGSPALEEPAVQSLLSSRYLPGKVKGYTVSTRASVHLEYCDIQPKP